MYISAEAKANWDTMTDAERVAAIKAGWDNVPRVEAFDWATCTNCGQTADAGFISRHDGHCYPCSKASTESTEGFEIECEDCGETFESDQGWLDSLSDDEPALCGDCEA